MRRSVVVSVLVCAVATGVPAVTAHASKPGCPAEASGARELTVEATADEIFEGLLEKPYVDVTELVAELRVNDRNDDGRLCLLTRWGAHLNPNSNWYRIGVESDLEAPVTFFIAFDNNASAKK